MFMMIIRALITWCRNESLTLLSFPPILHIIDYIHWDLALLTKMLIKNNVPIKLLERFLNAETIQFFKIVLNTFFLCKTLREYSILSSCKHYDKVSFDSQMLFSAGSSVIRRFRSAAVSVWLKGNESDLREHLIIIQTLWAGLPASLRSDDGQKHTLTESSRSD